MKAMGLIAGGLLGVGAVAAAAIAEEPRTGPQGGSAAAQADPSAEFVAWAAEQKGAIETITGAQFERDVPVKAVSTDEMAQMIGKTIEADMAGAVRSNGSPMSAIEIHVRATAAAFKVATRTFGMYRYEDRVVYVVPENVRTYAKRHGWSDDTVARAPRLAIAHEMIHALQDQKAWLGERFTKLSGEERTALRAVSEGQAVWATDQLAKKLDWGAANSVLWGVVTGVHGDEEPAPKGGVAPPRSDERVAPSSEVYSLGKTFVEAQAAWAGEGPKGTVRVWLTLVNPPTKMEQLKEPGKFEVKEKEIRGGSGGAGAGSTPASGTP